MSHPYRGRPATSFWSTGVALAGPGGLDPIVHARFRITPDDRVVTMGSCFAQHLSHHLVKVGMQFHVTEQPDPGMSSDEARRHGYGVFSARYGNIYTVRQACQLFDRAYGRFRPLDDRWTHGDRVVDPFRPQIEPDGFDDEIDMLASRSAHLRAVRAAFEQCDVLVLTLGLIETWEAIADGAVYPVAPGVHGGDHDPDHYRPVVFGPDDVIDDLEGFVQRLEGVNPKARLLLTVSPVPLVATHRDAHVIVSNTLSKSTLRVAAEAMLARHAHVDYFPSYEIISGSAATASYFEPDLRQVSEVGVQHVMRVFQRHVLEHGDDSRTTAGCAADVSRHVVCDEDLITATLEVSGVASDDQRRRQ